GIDALEHAAHVGDRCLSACRGRGGAAEEDAPRKDVLIGILVVRKNRLVGRMLGRRIDVPAHKTPRRRTLLVRERVAGNSGDDTIERGGGGNLESTEEDAAVGGEPRLDPLLLL